MAVIAAPRNRIERRATARLRKRRDDLWIALAALTSAMIALPLAQNSWHGPEVAAVLAVSATAMLANQRWAIALVVVAELLLLPTLVPRAFASASWTTGITSFIACAGVVPGLLAMKRAAAAMVLISGWQRTQRTCRRAHASLIALAALAAALPFL